MLPVAFIGLVGGIVEYANGGSSPSAMIIVAVIGAIVGGIGGVAALWRFRKLGDAEKNQMSTDAAEKAVEALEKALARYEGDINRALARVGVLQEELNDARTRIVELSAEVEAVEARRAELEHRLDVAMRRRETLERLLKQAQERLARLEREGGTRRGDTPQLRPLPKDSGARRRREDLDDDS